MNKIVTALLLTAAATAVSGCGLRSAEFYRDDVQKVLESKSGDIKSCYDKALEGNKTLSGDVSVKFNVAEESGIISNATVVGDSDAALQECVTSNIDGLKLDPPDVNPGMGTFTWSFSVGAPAKSAS